MRNGDPWQLSGEDSWKKEFQRKRKSSGWKGIPSLIGDCFLSEEVVIRKTRGEKRETKLPRRKDHRGKRHGKLPLVVMTFTYDNRQKLAAHLIREGAAETFPQQKSELEDSGTGVNEQGTFKKVQKQKKKNRSTQLARLVEKKLGKVDVKGRDDELKKKVSQDDLLREKRPFGSPFSPKMSQGAKWDKEKEGGM